MVLELLKERMSHAVRTKGFVHIKLKSFLKKIEHGEHTVEDLEKEFEKYVQTGIVDNVQSDMVAQVKTTERSYSMVFRLETRTILSLYDEFQAYYKGLQEFDDVEKHMSQVYGHLQAETKGRVEKVLHKINAILKKDADETHEILLYFARLMRDQYEAALETADGEQARERLRDMLVGVAFKDLAERLKMSGASRAARRINSDLKKEEDELESVMKILANLERDKGDERSFLKHLVHLERLLEDEDKQIDKYLKDTRFFLLLIMRHYFVILGEILKIKEEEDLLKKLKYPDDKFKELLAITGEEVKNLQGDAKKEMHKGYQLYHELEKISKLANSIA